MWGVQWSVGSEGWEEALRSHMEVIDLGGDDGEEEMEYSYDGEDYDGDENGDGDENENGDGDENENGDDYDNDDNENDGDNDNGDTTNGNESNDHIDPTTDSNTSTPSLHSLD